MTIQMIVAVCIISFHWLAIMLMSIGIRLDRGGNIIHGALFWGLASLCGVVPFGIIWYYIQGTQGNVFFGVITGICVLCGIFFLWHSQKLKAQETEKGEV